MQTTSTAIRQARMERVIGRGRSGQGRATQSADIREAFHKVFAARQDLAGKLAEQIVMEGQPELWPDSTALCSHFRLRKGEIGGEAVDAQVYRHEAGAVIRFWVYGKNFNVRTRDLILLTLPKGEEKGFEVWLEADGKVFPHEGGKYAQAGQAILANVLAGR